MELSKEKLKVSTIGETSPGSGLNRITCRSLTKAEADADAGLTAEESAAAADNRMGPNGRPQGEAIYTFISPEHKQVGDVVYVVVEDE